MAVSTLKPKDLADTEADTAVDTVDMAVDTVDMAVEMVDTAVDILTDTAPMLEIVDMVDMVSDPDMVDMDRGLDMVTDSAVYFKAELNSMLPTKTAASFCFTFRGIIDYKKMTCVCMLSQMCEIQ